MKRTGDLERHLGRVERAREAITKTMVRQFDSDEALARVVAADAIRQLLAPTRTQLLRAWLRRHTRKVVWSTAVPAFLAFLIVGIVLLVKHAPPTYPRTYTVSDTWRPSARAGIFDGSPKVDGEGGRCFLSERGDNWDCIDESMLNEIGLAVNEAVREGRQGRVWEGPNGSGEYWVIERTGRRFTVAATRAK